MRDASEYRSQAAKAAVEPEGNSCAGLGSDSISEFSIRMSAFARLSEMGKISNRITGGVLRVECKPLAHYADMLNEETLAKAEQGAALRELSKREFTEAIEVFERPKP